jgi:hypothetical protein
MAAKLYIEEAMMSDTRAANQIVRPIAGALLVALRRA